MSEQTGSTGPRPEQTFFDDPAIDRLMGVVMSLATEVYVLRDRLGALEVELDDKGVVSREALGAEPSDAQRAQSVADRDAFVEHLLSNLLGQQQSKGALR
tara:strand:+ start:2642 stop:2941 length:300 start_codon:yes stop_codon:yes gene_type:complete